MTDMRGRRTRIQAPGVDPAGIDPAAVKVWRPVGGEMPATHTHGATAEMGAAATHTHSAAAAAKVSSATPTAEMGATTPATAEVSTTTAAPSADVTTATATATAAAPGVSSRRQTKGYGYCGRACRDFPHGMTSSSGPNV